MRPFEIKMGQAATLRQLANELDNRADRALNEAFNLLPAGSVLDAVDGSTSYCLLGGRWLGEGLGLPEDSFLVCQRFVNGEVRLRAAEPNG